MHWTEAYVGKPYVSNGREVDGFDCWGLVCLIYKNELGIELPSYGVIDARQLLSVAHTMQTERMLGRWRKVDEVMPFDIVTMFGRTEGSRRVIHVGVLVDNKTLIHAQSKTHCAIERLDSPLIRSRIDAYWRHEDVA